MNLLSNLPHVQQVKKSFVHLPAKTPPKPRVSIMGQPRRAGRPRKQAHDVRNVKYF